MSGERVGVAISTTGHEHRLGFLETSVRAWSRALVDLDEPSVIYVTVDGTEEDVRRVEETVSGFAEVYRVGQRRWGAEPYNGRLGVAVNKNTGIELLMNAGVEHLFLSDDDTYPLRTDALGLHTEFLWGHSMVCWGKQRLVGSALTFANWNWPRGVMLHAKREVIERVGGMDERFGPGGHEHVEWSRRTHQAGLTPVLYPSPAQYAFPERGPAMGAGLYWSCEDMPRKGEPLGNFRSRKRKTTSIERSDGDWEKINAVMIARDGDTSFVPYSAERNGRVSATLSSALGRGARGDSQ